MKVVVRTREQGFTLIELMVVIVIIGILIGVALPNFMGAQDKAKISSVKANMHALQLGVEQYAGDNYGNYPNGVASSGGGFSWGTYVPSNPKNPFNQGIIGSQNMETDVGTSNSGNPVYTVAASSTSSGTNAGDMQYYADTSNKSTYAIIGFDKNKTSIKETTGGSNYVLHN